jgi:hypothetical protein
MLCACFVILDPECFKARSMVYWNPVDLIVLEGSN